MRETLREHRRLLYVALTRARDRLYVCGFESRKGDSSARLLVSPDWRKPPPRAWALSVTRGDGTITTFGTVDDEKTRRVHHRRSRAKAAFAAGLDFRARTDRTAHCRA